MTLRARCAEALVLALLLPVAAGAAEPWRVRVLGVDASRAAAPLEIGGAVLVDLAALAISLGVTVGVEGGSVSVRDREGTTWSGTAGASRLTAPGEEILLDVPLRLEGRSVYLPVAAVAELTGLSLAVDSAGRQIGLMAVAAGESAAEGWKPLELSRPVAAGRGSAGAAPLPSNAMLPADRESLRVDTTLAHVLGADWGGELAAVGSVRGWETRMSSLLAGGSAGLEVIQGNAVMSDPETGWGGEAGNLFSDIWGSAQGARVLWRRGTASAPRAWPSLSLYLADPNDGREAVLAYQDEISLGQAADLSGEVATDGSWFLRGRWERGRLGFFGFWRDSGDEGGEGISSVLELPRGAGVQAGWSRSGTDENVLELTTFSLHVPLVRGMNLGLESLAVESGFGRGRTDAVLLGAPVGPARLHVRWQRRTSEGAALFGRPPVRFEQDELRATAALAAGPRWKFELQSVSRWTGAESAEPWQQLAVSWRAGKRTELQAWLLSSGTAADDPLRLRLTQELPRGFALFAEYGRVSSFQEEDQGAADGARLKLQVRRTWQLGTPAGGELVTGRVVSPLGPPPTGTSVELGPYRTVTAADGSYAFRHVPRGSYEARVPEDALPAAWVARGARNVEVGRKDRAEIDLELVPLGHVRGRVWEDQDGDGRPSAEEGVGGAVVRLGDLATSTEGDGSFSFFNLPPGSYRLEIAADRLPEGLAPAIPSRMDLGLPPGGSLEGAALRVVRKKIPIIFQELP